MDGPPAVRVVRPRPLGVNDRIPVFWAGQEPTQELKQIDGGALYRHLVAANTPTGSKKRKRGHKYQAPKEGAPHDHWGSEPPQQPVHKPSGPIVIPKVRLVGDYELNQEAAAHHGPMIEGDIAAAPYLRHKEHLDVYDDHHAAEYDADEGDMNWLNNLNSKNGQGGILAAAIGLYHQMSARISGSSEQPNGPERQHVQQQQQQPLRLSVDEFERCIELLEKAHFDAVKAWWEEEQAGPSTSAPRVPEIPPMKALLPRAQSLGMLAAVVPDRKLALQVLEYWIRKRNREGGPVLARLWFEQPWKLVAFAHDIVDDDEDFDEHLPFMAVEPRSKQKQSRRGGTRRKMSEEDALEALYGLRNELEMVRTLADQVRKREKLKRQLLLVSQQEWQMRRQLGLPPAKGGGRVGKGGAAAKAAANKGEAGAAAAAAAAAVAAAGPSPRPGAAGPLGQGGSGRAAAGSSGRAMTSPPGSPNTELNKALARVALAAAAAASPHEGDKARQTRTSAAAAAAEYELTYAAKRRRLLATNPAAAAAAAAAAAPGGKKTAAVDTAAASGRKGQKRAGSLSAAGRKSAEPITQQQRGGRRGGAASTAAAAAAEAEAEEAVDSDEEEEDALTSPGSSAFGSGSEADYEADEEDAPSEDTELPSGLVSEGPGTAVAAAAAAAASGPARRQQAAKGRQKQAAVQQQPARRGRPAGRVAAAAARAAAAAASEDSSDVILLASVSEDEDEDEQSSEEEQQQQQQKGRQRGGSKFDRLESRAPRRGQQQPVQRAESPSKGQKQRQKQQGSQAPARGGARRNGYVQRGGAALPAMASSSELQAEADRDMDSDSAMQPKKRRKQALAAAAAAPAAGATGGRRQAAAAAAEADSGGHGPQVLRPLNQQPKHLRGGHTDAHKGSHKGASPAAAAAPAARAVAASGGRGGAVPAADGLKGHGGGSVRRSGAAATAAAVHRRRQRPAATRGIGQAELRSLGVADDGAAAPQGRRKGH